VAEWRSSFQKKSDGLRLQLRIPIQIIRPAFMQIVRREFAPAFAQFGDGGLMRALTGMHAGLGRKPAALQEIAGAAGGDDILPGGAATPGARDQMIES